MGQTLGQNLTMGQYLLGLIDPLIAIGWRYYNLVMPSFFFSQVLRPPLFVIIITHSDIRMKNENLLRLKSIESYF